MSSRSRGQKVRLDDVRKLDDAFASLPEVQNQEVGKTEAIRILLPRIQTLQSRGYSLVDIAERLTNGGVPMTSVLLRTYLIREGGLPHRRRSKPKKRTNAPENIGVQPQDTAVTTSADAANTSDTKPNTDVAKPPPPRNTGTTTPKKSGDSPAAPAEQHATTKASPTPRPANQPNTPSDAGPKPGPGRFIPRKDTDDI